MKQPIEHWRNLSLCDIIYEHEGEMKVEQWKDYDFIKGYYMVSDLGRIKSVDRVDNSGWNHPIKSQIMKQREDKDGYLTITYSINRIKNLGRCHVLVGLAFIPNPDSKPCINHKFGNKKDNRPSSLEWATYAENNQHAADTGLSHFHCGEDSHRAILKKHEALEIFHSTASTKELSKKFNISRATVRDIKRGVSWVKETGKVFQKSRVPVNNDDIISIYKDKSTTTAMLASRYKMGWYTIREIQSGKRHADITGHPK